MSPGIVDVVGALRREPPRDRPRAVAITSSTIAVICRRISSWPVRTGVERRDSGSRTSARIAPGSGDLLQHLEGQQPGAQAVVDVMGVVGDVVGDRRALRLEAGEAVELEVVTAR